MQLRSGVKRLDAFIFAKFLSAFSAVRWGVKHRLLELLHHTLQSNGRGRNNNEDRSDVQVSLQQICVHDHIRYPQTVIYRLITRLLNLIRLSFKWHHRLNRSESVKYHLHLEGEVILWFLLKCFCTARNTWDIYTWLEHHRFCTDETQTETQHKPLLFYVFVKN